MRVLVTGATGFLGANVVRAHLAAGHEVRCMLRPGSGTANLEGLPLELVRADFSRLETLRAALDGCEAVQHLAGLYDTGPGGAARMRSLHVDGTRNLCIAALDRGIKRLVLCSSSITTGFGTLDRPGDEETRVENLDILYPPGTALRAYHDTKLEAENLVRSYIPMGLEPVIVNPDYVIGPWDIKPTSGVLVVAMGRKPIPFYPLGGKCFVDARDCAAGHVLALERGTPGRRYLLANHNLHYRDFMAMIARALGRRPPFIPIPRMATRSLSFLANSIESTALARLDLPAGLFSAAHLLHSMQEERFRDGSRARRELGMPCTPMEHTISDTCSWFRSKGYFTGK